jgi:hypothetical protein
MRRFLILAGLAATVLVASAPAEARSRVGFGFHFGFPAYHPAYYAPYPYYYYPRPVYYAPPPVVYSAPPAGAAHGSPPPGAVVREGRDSSGNLCREYSTTTMIDGRPTPAYGTACQRPDGQWQIVN